LRIDTNSSELDPNLNGFVIFRGGLLVFSSLSAGQRIPIPDLSGYGLRARLTMRIIAHFFA
jgi:hypothetical protein